MHDLSRGRVVVTGGAGLIGSAIVWALNLRGVDDILVVDRLDTSEKWKNLVALRYRDYADADDFEARILRDPAAFAGTRTAFHMGACSSTTESDAGYLMRNNYEYSKNVAHWAVEQGIRLVYASSAATYGALETDLSDEADLDTLRPLNMYAYSKTRFDLHARNNQLLDRITGLKYFNVFGPNENHKGEMRSIVNKAFHQIRETGTVRLFKSGRRDYRDGEQRRDFLYVKDAAAMTLHLAEHDAFGIYKLGSGTAHTWLDLVRPLFRAMGQPESIEFIEMPPALRDRYQYYTRAIVERLRSSGYDKSITPLDVAVDDYARKYLMRDCRLDPARAESLAPA